MPITCDSGAQVSVVPEECIAEEEFTGETQVLLAIVNPTLHTLPETLPV